MLLYIVAFVVCWVSKTSSADSRVYRLRQSVRLGAVGDLEDDERDSKQEHES